MQGFIRKLILLILMQILPDVVLTYIIFLRLPLENHVLVIMIMEESIYSHLEMN